MTKKTSLKTLPAIAVRGLVVFPHMVFHFDVLRPKSVSALEAASDGDGYVFLTTQKDAFLEEPTEKDLYSVGTIVKIKQFLRLPNDGVRVLAEGVCRAELKECDMSGEYISASVTQIRSSFAGLSDEEYSAITRQLHSIFELYFRVNVKSTPDTLIASINEKDPGTLADSIAENFLGDIDDKQKILEIKNVKTRLYTLIDLLIHEIKVLQVESDLMVRVKEQMDENNREYFLREEQRAIAEELGEQNGNMADVEEFEKKLATLDAPEYVTERIQKELSRFSRLSDQSPESAVTRAYLETLFDLPWNHTSEENTDITRARAILEQDHYGMERVKERVVEHLAVSALTGGNPPTILCLYGPPGVGKTSIVKALAEAAGREYVRISLGGVRDEAEIMGHRRTYVGALPGRLVTALIKAKTSNPLILLDEIDKVLHDFKGDPASALLEVLDSAQNKAFTDRYLEIPLDLSRVMFVATANDLSSVPRPLLDRMELIELTGYTDEEKKEIAIRHLIPKQAALHGLKKSALRLSPDIVSQMIFEYTKEAGVRELERAIASLCRKCALELTENGKKSVTINKAALKKYLGEPRFTLDTVSEEPEIGVVTGLAWTSVGGEILSVEANVMEGSGKVELTGSLGDVMKESAMAAISYIRSKASELCIDPAFYKKYDIHIHVPEGATPKDGPSAGITIATALTSALTGRAVKTHLAMTGEITIRGRVLPIGGLKEKVLAAYRSGVTQIIIPKENLKDLKDIPESVKEKISFRAVSSCEQVFSLALLPAPQIREDNPFIPAKPLPNLHKGVTA
ncbi:MAG: endopeptidase La [Clostridia bacterium]|nr:endopeptidase La [Clostridia bacterium]